MVDASSAGDGMALETMQVVAQQIDPQAVAALADVFRTGNVSLTRHYQDVYQAVLAVTGGWRGQSAQAATERLFDYADTSSGSGELSRVARDNVAGLAETITNTVQPNTALTTPPPPAAAWQKYGAQSAQAQDQLQTIVNAANTVAEQQQNAFAPIAAPKGTIAPDSLPARLTVPGSSASGSSAVGGGSSYVAPAGGSGVSPFAPPHGDSGSGSVVSIPAAAGLGGGAVPASPPAGGGATYPSDESDFLPPSARPVASGSPFAPPGSSSAANWGAVAAAAGGAAVLGAAGNLGNRSIVTARDGGVGAGSGAGSGAESELGPGYGSGSGYRSGSGSGSGFDGGDVDEWPRLPATGSGGAGSAGQPGAGASSGYDSGSGSGYASGSSSDGSMPAAGEAGSAAAGDLSAAERAGLYPPMGGARRRDEEDDELTRNPDWMVEVNIFGTIRRVAPPTIGSPETFRKAGQE